MTIHQLEAARSTFRDEAQTTQSIASSSVPDLLPWADPYIADLHRQHAHQMRREKVAAVLGFNCRVRSSTAPQRSHFGSRPLERTIRSRTLSVRAW
jgi:hypothetical protein